MNVIKRLTETSWKCTRHGGDVSANVAALESGQVLFWPRLDFRLTQEESAFLTPTILGRSKNVSYRPSTDRISGTSCTGTDRNRLTAMLRRFSVAAGQFIQAILEPYHPSIRRERASFRPANVEGRVQSWRHDDSRLHVDGFPATPSQGRRILRVFCNVNPHGCPRVWRIGESFTTVAERFWDRLALPSSCWKRQLMQWCRFTKGYQTDYDHLMLSLHDAMKADGEYQQYSPQDVVAFPAGSTWACFADQVPHAAMAGQFQLEQTFSLPVAALQSPETAPLYTLERLAGRPLLDRPRWLKPFTGSSSRVNFS